MSELLEKARSYEAKKIAATDKESKPLFHISAPAGWINDPNGFSVYNGKIHLFYQYYPYLREWGPMHWGHSTTSDMIKWEQLPCVLAPDEEYDKKGCFSGSAIEADGKHVLVYTGVTRIKLPDGSEQERQNQCIAFGDGLNYVKHENNPVVTGDMLPENCSRIDFRDPKIWKEDDTYYLIVGSKDLNNVGQVVLCSSKNLTDWQFETILAANSTGKIGTMWECPDFFAQERINLFADATLDHQWIHIDTERAKTESPFKSTIAHGYLTLSMLPHLWNQIIEVNNLKMMINYGMDKMKFGQAVLSGQSIRLVASLHSLANLRGVAKAEIKFAIEIQGEKKKALEGIAVFLYYFN